MDLNNFVPEVYRNSRDFKVFLKLLSMIVDSTKYDIDNWMDLYDAKKCPQEFLPLLADLVGYTYNNELSVLENRIILSKFVSLLQNRGSNIGIYMATATSLFAQVASNPTIPEYVDLISSLAFLDIYFDYENAEIILYYPRNLKKIRDLLHYVRPVGTVLRLIPSIFVNVEDNIQVYTKVNGVVEKYLDVSFVKTMDTHIMPNKTYYIYDNSNRVYKKVDNPRAEYLSNYYENTSTQNSNKISSDFQLYGKLTDISEINSFADSSNPNYNLPYYNNIKNRIYTGEFASATAFDTGTTYYTWSIANNAYEVVDYPVESEIDNYYTFSGYTLIDDFTEDIDYYIRLDIYDFGKVSVSSVYLYDTLSEINNSYYSYYDDLTLPNQVGLSQVANDINVSDVELYISNETDLTININKVYVKGADGINVEFVSETELEPDDDVYKYTARLISTVPYQNIVVEYTVTTESGTFNRTIDTVQYIVFGASNTIEGGNPVQLILNIPNEVL